MQACHC